MKNLVLSILLLSIVLGSCNKASDIGSDLIDDGTPKAGFIKFLDVKTTTVKETSIPILEHIGLVAADSSYLLGSINDPVFGFARAELYTQFLPVNISTEPPFIDDNTSLTYELDSLELLLAYNYGAFSQNVSNNQSISIYELTETIDSLYSNKTFDFEPNAIGNKVSFDPRNTTDKLTFIEDDVQYEYTALRIKLSNDFAEKLFNPTSTPYTDEASFKSYLKGLYIKSDNTGDGILSFALSVSRMNLYYREISDTTSENKIYSYDVMPQRNKVVTYFEHNYSGGSIKPYLDGVNTSADGDSIIFVQGMSGTNGKITLSNLQDLSDLSINKAEIVVTLDQANISVAEIQKLPGQLALSDSIGYIDDALRDLNFFDGKLRIEGTTDLSYRYYMNITQYLQNSLNNNVDETDLFLSVYPKQTKANGIILGGSALDENTSSSKIKLQIIYTKRE